MLVLMAGLPGVGKTTLATYLGKILKWTVIDKDTIKDVLIDKMRMPEEKAGEAAFEVAFGLLKDSLSNGRSAILDSSALHQFIMRDAIQLCDDLQNDPGIDAEIRIVLCEVDHETRQCRLNARRQRSSQRHCTQVPEEAAQYFQHLPDNILKLWTRNSLESYASEALHYLQADVIPSPAAY